jgi:anti-sigma regulatory factor (Ser/Thr protein kinase)
MRRSFPRDLSSLELLFEFTGAFAGSKGLAEADVFAMNLAIEELFTNMIKYGGGDDLVSVDLEVRDEALVIELVHAGARRFDPTAAPVPDRKRSLADREPGGLGIELVRSMMDDITYEDRNGVARITVTKRLTPRGGV